MAVDPTVLNSVGDEDGSVKVYSWALTTANPTGTAVEMPAWADRTVDMTGTIGGATMTWEGANVNVDANFSPLSNAAGAAALTMAAVPLCKAVIENPRFQRPKLTTAGSGAVLTVSVTIRRANPLRT